MDEKTEELRDIFMDVSEEGTVTETQEEGPGSLATDEEGVDEDVAAVIDRMRDRFGFQTDLPDEDLVTIVRRYYAGDDDEALADAIGATPDAVAEARLDLHLFREGDADAPFDLDRLRDRGDEPADAVAEDLGTDAETVERYRRVLSAQADARQVSQRFQSEFEDVLADAGLSTTMTAAVREDGLDEATEDIDSLDSDADVSF